MKIGHRLYMSRDGREDIATVPYIRLSGHWLATLGFGVGQTIEVEVRGGEVVLRVVGPKGAEQQHVSSLKNEQTPHSTAAEWP